MQYSEALNQALTEFKTKDPQEMADLSGGTVKGNTISVMYCGSCCAVGHPHGKFNFEGEQPLSGEEQILILQYLNWAKGLPPRGQWLSFLNLPGGEHHNIPFQKEAIIPLARSYGRELETFRWRGEQYRGRKENIAGDITVVLPVLPRLPLAVVLWAEDEEYAARANILFDSVSEAYLPTASLYMMGILTVRRVWRV